LGLNYFRSNGLLPKAVKAVSLSIGQEISRGYAFDLQDCN
jgi:hypothetical protein